MWDKFPESFVEGQNGCTLDKKLFNSEFIVTVKSHESYIDISTGTRSRSVTVCIKDLYAPVLSNKGFLGMSARNTVNSVKDIDLNVMKVVN